MPFGLLSLVATGFTMNIFSAIGILMLFGVVKKNAILQVDYTNVLRERGLSRYDAVIKADHARLRPILMTTISIIAGMLPIALGKGDGSASRAAMATVVVGGQTLCLLLTLLVTPVIYTYFDDLALPPDREARQASRLVLGAAALGSLATSTRKRNG